MRLVSLALTVSVLVAIVARAWTTTAPPIQTEPKMLDAAILAPVPAAPVFGFSYEEEWGPFSQEFPTGSASGVHYVEFTVPKHNPDLGTLTRVVLRMQTTASYTPILGCSVAMGACSGGGWINYHWDAWVAHAFVTNPSLAMVSNSLTANWDLQSGASAAAGSCAPNYTGAWFGPLQGDDSGMEWGSEYTDQTTLDNFTGKEEEITLRVWWPQTFGIGRYGMSCNSYLDGWAISEGAVQYTYDP